MIFKQLYESKDGFFVEFILKNKTHDIQISKECVSKIMSIIAGELNNTAHVFHEIIGRCERCGFPVLKKSLESGKIIASECLCKKKKPKKSSPLKGEKNG
jgi:hypothetical protein